MVNASTTEPFVLSTPVVLFVFNRPDLIRQVLAAVRGARPPLLLVVGDGPRPNQAQDARRCREVRDLIATGVDWPCDTRTLYSDHNLGCGPRIFSGLQWAFAQVPEAIVLEDDCLPDPTFFRFCQEMLHRHRDDPRVFMITGTNVRGPSPATADRTFFSHHCTIWGWATWRRALAGYTLDVSWWRTRISPDELRPYCRDWAEHRFVCELLDSQKFGGVNTWDVQWFVHVLRQRGLSVVPGTNLISNLGTDGLHTRSRNPNHLRPTSAASFPLRPPVSPEPEPDYDRLLVQKHRPPGGWALGHLAARALRSPAGPSLRAVWRAIVRRR